MVIYNMYPSSASINLQERVIIYKDMDSIKKKCNSQHWAWETEIHELEKSWNISIYMLIWFDLSHVQFRIPTQLYSRTFPIEKLTIKFYTWYKNLCSWSIHNFPNSCSYSVSPFHVIKIIHRHRNMVWYYLSVFYYLFIYTIVAEIWYVCFEFICHLQ